jgi:hypothetical protein
MPRTDSHDGGKKSNQKSWPDGLRGRQSLRSLHPPSGTVCRCYCTPAFLLADEDRIQSRITLRGNGTSGGCQASENIAATRDNTSATLRCVSITPAHNMVCQYNALFGKIALVRFETFEHVICAHGHPVALFCKFFAASHGRCSSRSVLRLSRMKVGGKNQDGNRQ